ncbi:putative nuclease HARBI1 isoform X2 [Solenopsis invicta]|uniref:putative nuclease HARBI1 isoform X2 n=1 Tax=Solenopsis invicta TaxID=13686 RepID=UPI00193D493E|nr:putative nuclease HARBI1 isoform X2 [Solenopsis invicta]
MEVFIITQRYRTYESESENSSSDDEWVLYQQKKKRKFRSRIPNYINVVNNYMGHEFKSHFRMSRATFECLFEMLLPYLVRKIKGCPMIPPDHQLMIAIWKMATMDSYRATALRAVRRVTHGLFLKSSTFIKWPTGNLAIKVMRGFEESSSFPKTVGAIDGTHIRIDAPKENSVDYINRKGFHSIQLQLVCDHRTLITHCYAGHPGSVHDQRVFRQSEVANYLNDEEKFPADSHILGDAAYEIHQHLLTPYRDNGHLTAKQINYNYRLSAARVTVERCIGLLKGRMRSLLHCLPMSRVDLMAEYVIACCVIHNICTLRSDEIEVITILPTSSEHDRNQGIILPPGNQNAGGIAKRNLIMNSLQL